MKEKIDKGQVTMKAKFVVIFVLAWVFWLAAGCQNRLGRPSAGRVMLPPGIAGTWKAQDSQWKIVLAPDGTVSSAVIPLGEVEIKPNKTTKVKMKDGSYSTYKAGDCIVEYMPDTRELFVSVEMKDIHIRYLHNVIDGNSIDVLAGQISKDGNTWQADWMSFPNYTAHTPEYPNFKLAVDPNEGVETPLIFEKVTKDE